MNSGYKELATILESYYGVGSTVANPTTVMWAAEKLLSSKSSKEVKAQLSALNRVREKHGKAPAVAQYGSELF